MTQPTSISMRRRQFRLAVRLGVAWLLTLSALGLETTPARLVYASSLTVNTTSDSSALGDGLCTLREAILNANGDLDASGGDCAAGSGADTITFSITGTILLASTLPTITTNITLDGPGAHHLTLSGNNVRRVLAVDGHLTVNGLTIANGAAFCPPLPEVCDNVQNKGGGIYNTGSLSISKSAFSNNHAEDNGGAIYGGGTIAHSTFTGNGAGNDGGAIYGGLSVSNTTFSTNTAGRDGGGLYIYGGSGVIDNSVFSNNGATSTGGGVYITSGFDVTVAGSAFISNTAASGGAILNGETASLTIANSTFSGNTSSASGGGIFNNDGYITLTSSSFFGNSAGALGGGLYGFGNTTVVSSTFSGNSANRGGGIYNDEGLGIADSTLVSNTATLDGGGIYIGTGAGFNIANSTFSANTATRNGGGLFHSPASRGGPLTHVTFYGNGAASGGAIFSEAAGVALRGTLVAYSASGANCAGAADVLDNERNLQAGGLSCGNTIPSHPSTPTFCALLGPLDNNGGPTKTHALVLNQPEPACPPGGNPAINTVPLVDCAISADQRGAPRPHGAACDIGAFEFGPLPPVAVHDAAITDANIAVTVDVLANDSDLNPSDVLTVTAVTPPVHGTTAISGTAQVVYTPALNFVGLDVFTYTVSDGLFDSTAVVSVTVRSKRYLPIIRR